MDTKKLRQKILNLAIRGKLVPQDPNDEPASVLLERIKAEKEHLIKEGKIKRSKKIAKTSDTPHYGNVPFDIPDNWKWCKLGDIVDFQGGYAYKSNTYVNQSDWQVIRIGNVKNDNLVLDTQPVFVEEVIGRETKKYLLQKDDILFTMTGTKGKRDYFYSVKVPSVQKKLLLNQRVGCLRRFSSEVNIDFLCFALKGEYVLDAIFSTETGNVSQGNIGSENTLNLDIAIPPLAEQRRIVSEIERWFSLIDIIENGKQDLQTTIKQAKNKILDLAIHGKLVPQDQNDEPASELIKRINPKAKITCDNAQYEKIPENWCACKLVDICSFLSRGKSPKYSEDDKTYPVFAQKCNLKDGGISLEQARFLDPSTINKWNEVYKLQTGDILVNSTGTGTVGRTRLFNANCLGNYPFVVPDSHVSVVRVVKSICPQYVYAYISSDSIQQYMEENLAGSTNQKELYIGVLENMHIFLPPLAEQYRIVAKIEKLFSSLDNIQKALEV